MVEVGRVDRPHGLNGEVVVSLTTDRTERLVPGSVFRIEGGDVEVRSARPHQHRWLVSFAGLEDREGADRLRGAVLRAEPVHDDDALWAHDLIGAEVVTVGGTGHGVVVSIEANPASDLMVLASGTLVPTVFVVDDTGLPERVVVDPPAGLLDTET